MFNDEVAKLISRSGGVGVADAVLRGDVEGAGGGVMEPLEQVTVLMTLMKRLAQVMDHERAVLRSMRFEALPDIQDEKAALAEAYEIELGAAALQSRRSLASLEPSMRGHLHDADARVPGDRDRQPERPAGGPVSGRESACTTSATAWRAAPAASPTARAARRAWSSRAARSFRSPSTVSCEDRVMSLTADSRQCR